MTYKSLLVHVDNARAFPQRMRAALDLAERFQASLTGLCVIPTVRYSHMADTALSAQALEAMMAAARDEAAKAERIFEEQTKDSGLGAVCNTTEGEPIDRLVAGSRYVDLTVLGQHEPEDDASPRGLVEAVALMSGRPLLVVPYIGAPVGFGRRILVAWNGSREAARAVQDALPLLLDAEAVDVLGVGGRGEPGEFDAVEALCRYLDAQGVTATPHHAAGTDVAAGELVLSRLSDLGSDLLVMGAYGHSRMRELILGGVSRTVLSEMTVPALLSH